MRKKIALVFILIFAVIGPVSGASGDTTLPPKGVSQELWNAYKEVITTNIEGADRNIKWSTNPYYFLMGSPTSEDNSIFQGTISQIQKYCRNIAPFMTTSQPIKGVVFNYLPANKFNTIINSVPANYTSSYASYLYYLNQGLATFTTVVSSELSQQERNRVTQYRILQSMGFLNSTKNLNANIFSWYLNSDSVTEVSELDKQIIRLYCSSYTRSWDTAQQTLDSINAAWSKAPRSAIVPLSIKVGEYKNQLNFRFDFDPDQMIDYQVTGINYVILDSTGGIAKSGTLDVSTNLFQTYEVVLKGIKDKSRYSIEAVPVNSFGNGSLSTAKGTAGTQAAPQESGGVGASDATAEVIDAKNAAFDATNAAKEAIAAFDSAKMDCVAVSSDFDLDEQDLFDSTDLISGCSKLDAKASALKVKILALDPNKATTIDQANAITTSANKYAEESDALVAEIQDITDSLSATEKVFTLLADLLEPLNQLETDVIEPWGVLSDRLTILPSPSQALIKKTSNYKSASSFVIQAQKLIASRDLQLDFLSNLSDPFKLNAFVGTTGNLKASLTQISNFKKLLSTINKSIPPFVCQKGSLTVLASKAGKCAKGFESIPTS